MRFAPIQSIHVTMHEDGTYRLQVWRDNPDGTPVPTPLATVAGQQSIPEGLRALADDLEASARAEFSR